VSKKTGNKNEFDSFQDFDNKFSNNSPVSKKSKNNNAIGGGVGDRTREIYKHNEKILDNLDLFGDSPDKQKGGNLIDKTIDSNNSGSKNQVPLIDMLSGPSNTSTTPRSNNNVFGLDNINFGGNTSNTGNIVSNSGNTSGFGGTHTNQPYNVNLTNNNVYANPNNGVGFNNITNVQTNHHHGGFNNLNQNLMDAYSNNNMNYNIQGGSGGPYNPNRNTLPHHNNTTIDSNQPRMIHTEIQAKKEEPTNELKVRYTSKHRNKY
jgi:hypothetical protein